MNLYKYHTNPETLYGYDTYKYVMLGMIKDWLNDFNDPHSDNHLDMERRYDFEEWFRKNNHSNTTDLLINSDEYIDIMGLEFDEENGYFRFANGEEWIPVKR